MSLSTDGPARTGANRRTYPRPRPATSDDYVDFCLFLQQLCGIELLQYKRPQMERRLRSFYAQRGVTDLRDSFPALRGDATHLSELLDRVTINVSQLWRNPEQWDLIEAKLIPALAERGGINAWSAGCSYGAEAYTLAALCHLAGAGSRLRVTIHGTDIDRRMIARARRGRFSEEDARSAPRAKLLAGFAETEGNWQAKPGLMAMTSFELGDLLTMSPRPGSYDLILCRNTVIYFNEPIRDQLHARLASALRPGGFLMVGSTERVAHAAELGLASAYPFIYRKS
ncbi:protein-glutamate O-methyltransferase CheR [Conexibacter sp. DBS9H8]|uniref:CheR family methyltransferase n=1 Tax=Conexibacter sp. DBS9H8 TaxID=2937801 RepID=UPI00200F1EFF|nr:protein-glutamate O-methyltransferase CheR [Conexibacter sp. DBS9H8]